MRSSSIGPAVLLAGAAHAAFGQAAMFRPLGLDSKPSPVGANSHATAVSADGSVVAGFAYRYDGVHQILMAVPMYRSDASGVWQAVNPVYATVRAMSADATVVVGTHAPPMQPFTMAFRNEPIPEMTLMAGIGPAMFNGLSGDGIAAVGSIIDLGSAEAFRWTEVRGVERLGHLPGWNTLDGAATDASFDGSVVVGSDGRLPDVQAFRWAGSMQGLGFLGPALEHPFSAAAAVSADGSTVVGQSRNAAGFHQAFIWRAPGPMRPLPFLGGAAATSAALDVSADGSVVVGAQSTSPTWASTAYYWDRARGRRDLRQFLISLGATGLDGWTLTKATAISPDGAFIVGDGIDPDGRDQAWLARIPAFCYANCDGSTIAPVLSVNDFVCFQTRFAASDAYANCDSSTTPPVLNVGDFICFQSSFAAGCP